MKIKDLPEIERPAFRLRYYGPDRLSDTELMQLLAGTNELETANEILEASGGLPYLNKMSIEEFESISGVGEATAMRIVAALELGRRSAQPPPIRKQRILSSDDAYKMFAADALSQQQEVVSALILNAKYEVISKEFISKGGIMAANVDPRDVFRPAVKRGAIGIILAHNHPSGDPTPSEDDIYATKRIEQCGEMIGIKVVDHIIIGHGRFESMRDLNQMEFDGLEQSNVAEIKDKGHERERTR